MFATLFLSTFLLAADTETEVREHAFELVAQLGHKSFKFREKASDEIGRIGSAALEPLRKGIVHPDTEIAERCRKLLPHALDCRMREQIEVFLAKPECPLPADLPAIQRWLKVVGTGKESRELYALLVREQRRILVEVEQSPEKAGDRYYAFCADVYSRTRIGTVESRKEIVSYSDLILFLFLGSDPNCRKGSSTSTSTACLQANVFLNSSYTTAMLSGATANDATKKIFLSWLEQERYHQTARRGFQLAASAEMKEAVPVAIRVASDPTALQTVRSYALLGSARLFGPEHIKLLEPLMEDKTPVGRIAANADSLRTEMRDIALGIAIHATGQKAADYGYDRFRDNQFGTTSYYYYAMNDEKREAALKMWSEWVAKQKK